MMALQPSRTSRGFQDLFKMADYPSFPREAPVATMAGDEPGCVLVVEDDPMLRRGGVRTLKTWGYTILEAPDGGAALDQVGAAEDELSVILLDVMLPVLNGVEV